MRKVNKGLGKKFMFLILNDEKMFCPGIIQSISINMNGKMTDYDLFFLK